MGIFSRRTLRRWLWDALSTGALDRVQAEHLVSHVNRDDDHEALRREWELAALAAFSTVGTTRYEGRPAAGAGPADIQVMPRCSDLSEFQVEVATVSDQGYDAANPIHLLVDAVKQVAKRARVPVNRLAIRVASTEESELAVARQRNRVRVPVPRGVELERVVKEEIRPFLQRCSEVPDLKSRLVVANPGVDVVLDYDPARRYHELAYPSYKIAHDDRSNPVWHRLQEKGKQLSKRRFDGVSGILIADAGCSLLGDRRLVDRICQQLFRGRSSVSFVAVATIGPRFGPSAERFRPLVRVLSNPHARHRVTLTFETVVAAAFDSLPPAVNTPGEAYENLRLEGGPLWGSFVPGWSLAGNTYKVSARAVMMVLAGAMSQKDFLRWHKLDDSPENRGLPWPLVGHYRAGHTIQGVRLEPCSDEDDDWLVFTFTEHPDPALAAIRLPD